MEAGIRDDSFHEKGNPLGAEVDREEAENDKHGEVRDDMSLRCNVSSTAIGPVRNLLQEKRCLRFFQKKLMTQKVCHYVSHSPPDTLLPDITTDKGRYFTKTYKSLDEFLLYHSEVFLVTRKGKIVAAPYTDLDNYMTRILPEKIRQKSDNNCTDCLSASGSSSQNISQENLFETEELGRSLDRSSYSHKEAQDSLQASGVKPKSKRTLHDDNLTNSIRMSSGNTQITTHPDCKSRNLFCQKRDINVESECIVNLNIVLLQSVGGGYHANTKEVHDLLSKENLKNVCYIFSHYKSYLNFILYHSEVFNMNENSEICSSSSHEVQSYLSNVLPSKLQLSIPLTKLRLKGAVLQSIISVSESEIAESDSVIYMKKADIEKQLVRRIGKKLLNSFPKYFNGDLTPLIKKTNPRQMYYFWRSYSSVQEYIMFHSEVFSVALHGQIKCVEQSELKLYMDGVLHRKLEIFNSECIKDADKYVLLYLKDNESVFKMYEFSNEAGRSAKDGLDGVIGTENTNNNLEQRFLPKVTCQNDGEEKSLDLSSVNRQDCNTNSSDLVDSLAVSIVANRMNKLRICQEKTDIDLEESDCLIRFTYWDRKFNLERECIMNLIEVLSESDYLYHCNVKDMHDLIQREKLKNIFYVFNHYKSYLNFILYHSEVFNVTKNSEIRLCSSHDVLSYAPDVLHKKLSNEIPLTHLTLKSAVLQSVLPDVLAVSEGELADSHRIVFIKNLQMESQCVRRIGKGLNRNTKWYFNRDLTALFSNASPKQKYYFWRSYASIQEFIMFHSNVFCVAGDGLIKSSPKLDLKLYGKGALRQKLQSFEIELHHKLRNKNYKFLYIHEYEFMFRLKEEPHDSLRSITKRGDDTLDDRVSRKSGQQEKFCTTTFRNTGERKSSDLCCTSSEALVGLLAECNSLQLPSVEANKCEKIVPRNIQIVYENSGDSDLDLELAPIHFPSEYVDSKLESECIINISHVLLESGERSYYCNFKDVHDLMGKEKFKNSCYLFSRYKSYLNFILFHSDVFCVTTDSQICVVSHDDVQSYLSNSLARRLTTKVPLTELKIKSAVLRSAISVTKVETAEIDRIIYMKHFEMERKCIRKIAMKLDHERSFHENLSPLFSRTTKSQRYYFWRSYASVQEFIVFHSEVFTIAATGQIKCVTLPEVELYINRTLPLKLKNLELQCLKASDNYKLLYMVDSEYVFRMEEVSSDPHHSVKDDVTSGTENTTNMPEQESDCCTLTNLKKFPTPATRLHATLEDRQMNFLEVSTQTLSTGPILSVHHILE